MQHHATIPDNPRQIEAQLDQDRDALSAALEALRQRFSPDSLWSDGAALVKANAGPYTQALDAAVRANPVALALTAIGLAWLILGRRSSSASNASPLAGTRFEAEARWEDDGGPVAPLPETDALWMEEADRLRQRADAIFARITTASRDNLAPSAVLAGHRADVAAALARDIRRVMARGLENLTGSARDAALAARERAYLMRIAAAKAGAEAVRDNPVVAGMALAAAGATVAALLPQSAFENQVLGAPRDRLVGDVKRVLQDERQLLAKSVERVAKALTT
ncbi:DUF3618 domain-containing protein [Tabrizicola sp.]|uniref:DUF3618 domain-containing protein n=1 Tax=Tabrizicola sp. TaxID=2005166 RepID=UPI00286A0412|nr:DUF3618 domain-containing protein [Tabrizicola sp.]